MTYSGIELRVALDELRSLGYDVGAADLNDYNRPSSSYGSGENNAGDLQ